MISTLKEKLLASLLVIGLSLFQVSRAEAQLVGSSANDVAIEDHVPVNVIFDTDMWSDMDDMLALAMLHALHDRHEINLVAVTISTEDPWSASYVDLVDTFYGHSRIPVGLVHHGITAEETREKLDGGRPTPILPRIPYVQAISERRDPDGSLSYPHQLVDGSKAQDAETLLRKTLAAQPDDSVVMIQVGFSNNLARLLDSPPDGISPLTGRELIRKKVRFLPVMAGKFADTIQNGKVSPKSQSEFNLRMDVPSAQKLFDGWPTPIVDSGFEIGLDLLFPAKSIAEDFSYVRNHPIADSYRSFTLGPYKWPHDHSTYDLTAVLYAARPERGYFTLSRPGKITVLPDGSSKFEEIAGGKRRYLILEDSQRARALEAMVMLASQPPVNCKP